MKREARFGLAPLRSRAGLELALWSIPEVGPAMLYGIAVARAIDRGFLAGKPLIGFAWLGGLVLTATIGAVGVRQVYRRLGALVEPLRDDLVDRVVAGALRNGAAGRRDDGVISRLTRQVEIVRDTYAGLLLALRGFAVAAVGVASGLLSLEPLLALLILPPFLLGFAASLSVLGLSADRVRASIHADEQLSARAGEVFAATRDLTAARAEEWAAELTGRPVEAHARAERALATTAALRTLCFALGGWAPLVILLATAPWLLGRGMTPGALLGGLTYVLVGLQPALSTVLGALGDSGLRYVITLRRILDATAASDIPVTAAVAHSRTTAVEAHRLTFGYGPHAEPVLKALDLTLRPGDHLAVVGPSGIGKSTLAGLVCGLLTPTSGEVLVAPDRVLIPQEAYVFSGTVLDNLRYLAPHASQSEVRQAARAVGASPLLLRLGGLDARVRPDELSAGERQLIALARSYLSPAPLAVLDEATCHLDPDAERHAEEAFAARCRRKEGALIVIAHRISSALRARHVLVLDGNRASYGDHAMLLQTSPLYRELVGNWHPAPVARDERGDQIQPAS